VTDILLSLFSSCVTCLWCSWCCGRQRRGREAMLHAGSSDEAPGQPLRHGHQLPCAELSSSYPHRQLLRRCVLPTPASLCAARLRAYPCGADVVSTSLQESVIWRSTESSPTCPAAAMAPCARTLICGASGTPTSPTVLTPALCICVSLYSPHLPLRPYRHSHASVAHCHAWRALAEDRRTHGLLHVLA
jgi:hypothetical protein